MSKKNEIAIKLKDLKEDKKLGEGSFGVVYLGTFRGNKVAIKKLKQIVGDNNDDEKKLKEFEKEVELLNKCDNPNIIHFYGAVFDPNFCIVTEFAEFGSLQDLINKRNTNPISMKLRTKMMIDAAHGIAYLHSNEILHRDIKPDNMLVVSLDKKVDVNVKITDFGTSKSVDFLKTQKNTIGVGTPAFMAPEVLESDSYNEKADIFSFAITMYECFGWCYCYPKSEFKYSWDITPFIKDGKRRPKTDNMTNEQYQLIENCWKTNPNERLRIGDVIKQLFMISNQIKIDNKRLIEEEKKQIEEWTNMKYGKTIFDSKIDDWNQTTSVFDQRIINRINLIFIIKDEDGNKFGGYINTRIEKLNEHITDPNAFIFSLRSNGRLNGMMKFDIQDKVNTFYLNDKSQSCLFDLGGQFICIRKQNNKNQSYCFQGEHDICDINNVLCGKTDNEKFSPKRITVIQLDCGNEVITPSSQNEIQQLELQIQKLKKENKELIAKKPSLQQDIEKERMENAKKSMIIEDLKKKIKELECENSDLKNGIAEVKFKPSEIPNGIIPNPGGFPKKVPVKDNKGTPQNFRNTDLVNEFQKRLTEKKDLVVQKKFKEENITIPIPIINYLTSTPFEYDFQGYALNIPITPDVRDGENYVFNIETSEEKIRVNCCVYFLTDGILQRDGLNLIATLTFSKEYYGVKTTYPLQIGNREPIPLEFEIKEGVVYESNDQGLVSNNGRKGSLKVIIQLV